MVLVRCSECGQQVSSQMAKCPKCGTAVDLGGSEYQPPGLLRRLLVPLSVVALLALGVLLWRLASNRVEHNQEVTASRSAESIQRVKDSTRVLELLGLPLTDPSALEADDLVHREGMEILHAAVHERAADVRLDSAGRLLEPPDYQSVRLQAGRVVLGSITPPLLPPQEARRIILARVVDDKSAMADEPDPAKMRSKFAARLEAELRQSRVEGKLTTLGAGGTTLHLAWRLVSRELANQRGTDVMLRTRLRALGFQRLEITDGYDMTWSWDLKS